MAYKITETSKYSGNIKTIYSVKIKFDSNVSHYINGGLKITITDNLNHGDMLVITSEDIANGDYTLISGTDIETRLNDSLEVSNGFVAYFSAYDTLNIAMAAKSTNGTNTIGFYASDIKIELIDSDVVKESIILTADLFPLLIRNETLRLYDGGEDPVFTATNMRQAYDFNKNVDNDITKYFNYNTTDSMYVNTSAEANISGMVPLYVSDVSAFTINVSDRVPYNFNYDWDYALSYLYDIDTGNQTDIRWLPGEMPQAEEISIEIIPGYYATVDLYKIEQLLYKNTQGYYKNKLCFELRSRIQDIENE